MLQMVWLVLAFALIIAGAQYFMNAIEWLGRHLRLSDSATGSLLAAIGTAMPETLVPIVAIFFAGSAHAREIGIGGILGAPFMLSTLAMLIVAGSLWVFRNRRFTTNLEFNSASAQGDLTFFLSAYALAFGAALLPVEVRWVRWAVAVALIPLYGLYMRRLLKIESEPSEEDLRPLHIINYAPRWMHLYEDWARSPGLGWILVQVGLALGLIVGGADLFVQAVEGLGATLGVAPLILSLLITPVATELPETLNSAFWIRRRKDTLAFGNVSGAMVFQSVFPVTIGILFTSWSLSLRPGDASFLPALSCVLALLSGAMLLFFVRRHESIHLTHLLASGSLYVVFVVAVLLTMAAGLSG